MTIVDSFVGSGYRCCYNNNKRRCFGPRIPIIPSGVEFSFAKGTTLEFSAYFIIVFQFTCNRLQKTYIACNLLAINLYHMYPVNADREYHVNI